MSVTPASNHHPIPTLDGMDHQCLNAPAQDESRCVAVKNENLDFARQNQIETQRSKRGGHSQMAMSEKKDRSLKVAACQKFYSPPEGNINSESPEAESFADSTYLKISEEAARRLEELKSEVGIARIFDWIGYGHHLSRHYLNNKKNEKIVKAPIRDIRIINENAKGIIVELNKEDIVKFNVIDSARETLKSLSKTKLDFTEISKDELNSKPSYLDDLKNGHILSISREMAEKIEKIFKTEVFCLDQIFEHACNEKVLPEVMEDYDLLTTLVIDQDTRRNLDKVRKTTKDDIFKITKTKNFFIFGIKSTALRNAVVTNQCSSSEVFKISVRFLKSIPCSKQAQKQVKILQNNKKKCGNFKSFWSGMGTDPSVISSIAKGKTKKISFDLACRLNSGFEVRIFKFKKIFREAMDKAFHFYDKALSLKTEIPRELSCAEKRKIEEPIPPLKKFKPNPPDVAEHHNALTIASPHSDPCTEAFDLFFCENQELLNDSKTTDEDASTQHENSSLRPYVEDSKIPLDFLADSGFLVSAFDDDQLNHFFM